MSTGFIPLGLDQQPDGYPPIGYEFEYAYPPRGPRCGGYGNIDIHTYRVIGWERHVGSFGERISVRTKPIACRTRRVISVSYQHCSLGHVHEVFEYDDNSPLNGRAPECWGF